VFLRGSSRAPVEGSVVDDNDADLRVTRVLEHRIDASPQVFARVVVHDDDVDPHRHGGDSTN
jgi:hypothetical protein